MSSNGVVVVANLPFGQGKVGQVCATKTPQQQAEFGESLNPFLKRFTIYNTADCVEDRPFEQIGRITDPELIENRVTCQLPGGLVLPITKAATAADLALIRDAKNFTQAFETLDDFLAALGYRDSAHEDCGASGTVEKSVANEVPEEPLREVVPALSSVNERLAYYLGRNRDTKRQKLGIGFYGVWNRGWHEDRVASRNPDNFARLAKDLTGNVVPHTAEGVMVSDSPDMGFAKTAFAHKTGKMSFGFTPKAKMIYDIAEKICGSDEETARFLLELQAGDPAGVFNNLAAQGMTVYAKAA